MVLKPTFMCRSTKCKNCDTMLPACQLINGYCPACWTAVQNAFKKTFRWLVSF